MTYAQSNYFKDKVNPKASVITFNDTYLNSQEFRFTSHTITTGLTIKNQLLLFFKGDDESILNPKNEAELIRLSISKGIYNLFWGFEYVIGLQYYNPFRIIMGTQSFVIK